MKTWKKYLAMAFFLCVISVCMLPVRAKENMQLMDQAGLLSEAEAEEINARLTELETRTGWEFMALTTDDAGGKDATSFVESWFDNYTAKDDGVICAIDMDNREIVVRAFGEAMYYITDMRAEKILDAGYEEISGEKYAAALQEMLQEVENSYQDENGIDLNDCEKVNNEINDILDEADYIKEQYFLEISSPGIERILKKDKHLEMAKGKQVEVKLFSKLEIENGKKEYVGTLKSFDNEAIYIEETEKEEIKILRKNISNLKLKYNW